MNAVSSGGIIWKGDKICFIKFPGGKLSFPKGTMEDGETEEETAIREVQEETGLSDVKIIKKLGVLTRMGEDHNRKPVMKDIHLYLMRVDDFTQGGQDEITEWLTPEEAYPRLFKEEREFLQNLVK